MPLSFGDLVLVRRKVASTSASIPNISPSSARFSLTLVSVALAILFLLSLVVYYTVRIFFNTPVSSHLDMETERDPTLRYWHTADLVIGEHPHALAYPLRRATRVEVEVISGHIHIPWFNPSFSAYFQRKRSWTLSLSQVMYSHADHTPIKSKTATTFDYDYGSKSKCAPPATGPEMLQIPPSSPQPATTGPVERTATIQSSRSPPSSPALPRSPSPRRKPVPPFTIQTATPTPSTNASSSPSSSPVLSESGMAKTDPNPNASPSLSSSPPSPIPGSPRKRASTFFPPGEPPSIEVVSRETRRRSTIGSSSVGATMLTRSRPRARGGEVVRGRGRGSGRSQESENPPVPITLLGPPPMTMAMAMAMTTATTTATEKLHLTILRPHPDQNRNMSLSLKVSRLINLCAPRPSMVNVDPTLHPRARPYPHFHSRPGPNA